MAADPLSDLLKTVRLTGAVFFEIAAEEPWAVGSPAREQILPKILPGADHLIAYHVARVAHGGQLRTLLPANTSFSLDPAALVGDCWGHP